MRSLHAVAQCFVTMVIIALGCTCSQEAAGGATTTPSPVVSDADKTLIPHASWNCGMADGIPQPEKGVPVFEAEMKLDHIYDVGRTPFGRRQVLVVKEGTVAGEKIKGSVTAGALDFELALGNGVVEIEQVMVLRTSDNRYIYARNAGTGSSAKDVRIVMDFEAPNGSTAAWLNTGKYVARRTVDATAMTMKLSVYEVSAIPAPDPASAVRITKPADVPSQPWDYRRAAAGEQQAEQLITENVALGGSQSVGASKRGNRNIIPITGGTLTGLISGKVLPGGADYQSTVPAIDARYLWQATEGDIIIVRNTGPFGSLVPTFEVRIDSKYAFLNSGTYLSSNPGMGAGGVSITFYKSK
jgi:hypothetical protein